MIMNVLAAAIASYGLLSNSPVVVVAAMIIAMLVGPIMGVGLALLDNDLTLFRKSLFTLFMGGLGAFVVAFIIGGIVHRNLPMTAQIMARTAPNLFDLMIALAGGAAAAYVTVSPRLNISFIGVALATSLLVPLAAASILLSRGETKLAMGAFLLSFTNMVAIEFASSVVIWLNGFQKANWTTRLRMSVFMKRNIVSIGILILIAVIFSINLQQITEKYMFETTVNEILRNEIDPLPGSFVTEVWFETMSNTTIVRALVRGPNPPSAEQVGVLEAKLPDPPDGTKLELRIRFVQTLIINRNGLLYTDVKFGDSI
jgi:uncharacterized hydrophobic protein (TIGR00271 family)